MLWDFMIGYVLFTFAVAGWNLGGKNSWRTPIAIVVATVVTQWWYIEVAAYIEEQSRLPGAMAVFFGYIAVWLFLTLATESVLCLFFPLNLRPVRGRFDKFSGAAIGASKGFVMLTLASLASVCAVDFPNPPRYPMISAWISLSSGESWVLDKLKDVAVHLPMPVIGAVVSVSQPGHALNFSTQSALQAQSTETSTRIKELLDALQDLQREAGDNL